MQEIFQREHLGALQFRHQGDGPDEQEGERQHVPYINKVKRFDIRQEEIAAYD
jgi:hypothetical protein